MMIRYVQKKNNQIFVLEQQRDESFSTTQTTVLYLYTNEKRRKVKEDMKTDSMYREIGNEEKGKK